MGKESMRISYGTLSAKRRDLTIKSQRFGEMLYFLSDNASSSVYKKEKK
jgi:hypothetical protein